MIYRTSYHFILVVVSLRYEGIVSKLLNVTDLTGRRGGNIGLKEKLSGEKNILTCRYTFEKVSRSLKNFAYSYDGNLLPTTIYPDNRFVF